MCRQPDVAFDEHVLKRAKAAIRKQLLFIPRPKMWIRLPVVQRLLALSMEDITPCMPFPLWNTLMWILTAYAFLLRQVLSALTACACGAPMRAGCRRSACPSLPALGNVIMGLHSKAKLRCTALMTDWSYV